MATPDPREGPWDRYHLDESNIIGTGAVIYVMRGIDRV